MADLICSSGMSIWGDSGPVHLSEAAYDDIGSCLLGLLTQRPRLESVVTMAKRPSQEPRVLSWIVGASSRGRGGTGRGFGAAGGQ